MWIEPLMERTLGSQIHLPKPVWGKLNLLWVANFVLMSYGTGAVMAVPGHDERDWEFAGKYGIPIKQVIFSADGSDCGIDEAAFVEKGVLKNSGQFDGLISAEAFDAIAAWLESNGKGGKTVNFRLRDWGVSRQRYWGCPIPVINRADGTTVPTASTTSSACATTGRFSAASTTTTFLGDSTGFASANIRS